jgi:hypothetical protein
MNAKATDSTVMARAMSLSSILLNLGFPNPGFIVLIGDA